MVFPNLVVRCTRLWEEATLPTVLLQPQLHAAQKGHTEFGDKFNEKVRFPVVRIGKVAVHVGRPCRQFLDVLSNQWRLTLGAALTCSPTLPPAHQSE